MVPGNSSRRKTLIDLLIFVCMRKIIWTQFIVKYHGEGFLKINF